MSEDKKDVKEEKGPEKKAEVSAANEVKQEAAPKENTPKADKAEAAANQEAPASDETQETTEDTKASSDVIQLSGLFARKVGMASVYNEKGVQTPVTVLKLDQWKVTQVKTPETDGYSAVQISLLQRKEKNTSKAEKGHLKKANSKLGALFTREIRQDLPEGVKPGQAVAFDSLAKGDTVKITGKSKGRGFSGVLKRWNFGGGPASHGSTFHRQPGSIGNCEAPGQVMPGRKMPGKFGDEQITVKNVKVVDVQLDEGLLLVKGPVPGAKNGLIRLQKQ